MNDNYHNYARVRKMPQNVALWCDVLGYLHDGYSIGQISRALKASSVQVSDIADRIRSEGWA